MIPLELLQCAVGEQRLGQVACTPVAHLVSPTHRVCECVSVSVSVSQQRQQAYPILSFTRLLFMASALRMREACSFSLESSRQRDSKWQSSFSSKAAIFSKADCLALQHTNSMDQAPPAARGSLTLASH